MPYPGQIPFPGQSGGQAGRPKKVATPMVARARENSTGFSLPQPHAEALQRVHEQYLKPGTDGVRLPPRLQPGRLPNPLQVPKNRAISKGWGDRYRRGQGATNG